MDYVTAVYNIYGNDVDFNSACFNFTEEEARLRLLWRDERPMPTNQQLIDALNVVNKNQQIKVKYDEMVKDIYDQMLIVFGTNNDVSASAFASTWEAMKKRPANYIDAELGFNNEADVIAYTDTKLALADGYGIFRMKRIAQFNAEKQAILNG